MLNFASQCRSFLRTHEDFILVLKICRQAKAKPVNKVDHLGVGTKRQPVCFIISILVNLKLAQIFYLKLKSSNPSTLPAFERF